MSSIDDLIERLSRDDGSITFEEVIAIIDAHYAFTPTRFTNGDLVNEAGENNGSCKIFAFAMLHHLSMVQTLECFGDYYRIDVMKDPKGESHQNIRNFMRHGWAGVGFEDAPLG